MVKQASLTSFFNGGKHNPSKSAPSRKRSRQMLSSSTGGVFRSKNNGSGFGVCPLCQRNFAWHVLESHASECTGNYEGETKATNGGVDANDNNKSPNSLLPTTLIPPASKSKVVEISPLKDTDEVRKFFTETKTSDIATPRLAPVFQARKKTESRNDKTQKTEYSPLCPHSYEPIPGLFVYEDFITEEEEALILKGCVNVGRDAVPPWKTSRFNGKHIGKRWGVHCNLRDRRVDAPEYPLPSVLQDIIFPKLRKLNLPMVPAMKNFVPNEANAIDYRRREGHWLQAHVDDRKLSKEPIANLSMIGDCYMTFRNVAKHRNLAIPQQRVLLKRRCLQVLTGKSRYDFSHAIANADLLSDRRVSITMRESPLTFTKK